jgi:hypothetical protein
MSPRSSSSARLISALVDWLLERLGDVAFLVDHDVRIGGQVVKECCARPERT